MENASKAVLIAGGVLLALIVLSLILVLANNMNTMAEAENKRIALDQLTAFNQEYEAFNKKAMYGTDIITVTRKAMENNKQYSNDINHENYIDVVVSVKNDYTKSKKTIIYSASSNVILNENIVEERILEANNTYRLSNPASSISNRLVILMSMDVDDSKRTYTELGNYIEEYTISALTSFKRALFKCTEVHYDSDTKRVDRIEFEER